MTSIQLLKKENASLGKQTKEHKRSEFIQQLNKEIADQDVVIDVLRGLVNDPKKADSAIIQTLSKGPARIRVATREELKIEIKELKAKLLKYEKKKNQGGVEVDEEKTQIETQQQSLASIKLTEAKFNSGNAEYIMKINELNNQVEDLNLLVAGKQTEVDKYKQLISKKNQEIIELTQAKIDLKFMITKNEELKNEVESLRQKINSDLYQNYDQEIKLEELELANNVHKNLQNKTNEAIKLEFETLQTKLAELISQNKQLLVSNTKLKDESVNMRKLLDDAKERNRKLHSEHEEQISKLTSNVKDKDNAIKALNLKITDYENQYDQLTAEIKDKEGIIADFERKVVDLEERLEKHHERSSSRIEDQSFVEVNKELEARKQELGIFNQLKIINFLEIEGNHMKQDIFRLRERIKELTKTEIELSDRIDILEQENRFLSKKVIAAHLIVKEQYNDTMTPQEVQNHVKDLTKRYESRIKEMTLKINEIEARNKELEEIQQIINNPISNQSLHSNSIALTEGENEILTDKI